MRQAIITGLLVGMVVCSVAQPVIRVSMASEASSLGKDLHFFMDSSRRLTVEEVQHARFQQSKDEISNFGFTTSAVWIKFSVMGTVTEQVYVEIDKPLLDSISLFIPLATGGYSEQRTGSKLPLFTRSLASTNFILPLSLEKNVPLTYYIRVVSGTSVTLPLRVGTLRPLTYSLLGDIFRIILVFGAIALLALYNFFIFFIFKDKSYLYFIVYISLVGIFLFHVKGYSVLLFPFHNYLDDYYNQIWYCTDIFILLFAIKFLKLKVVFPNLYRLYSVTAIFFAVLLISCFFIKGENLLNWVANYVELFIWYSLIFTGILAYRKGNTSALFYVTGWAVFVNFSMFNNLCVLGIFPYYAFVPSIIPLGCLIEVVLFGVGLAYRFYQLKQENEQVLTQNLNLTQAQNKMLEQRVEERTYELNEKNTEIAAQNEELVQQQEQLALQRDILEEQNEELTISQSLIEEQTQVIFAKNLQLEHEVELRTLQLTNTNQELSEYNSQLEQFAFAMAHNLRSPAARILGLGNLLALPDMNAEKDFIINQIINATLQLDIVIRDMNEILEIRQNKNMPLTEINLHDALEKAKRLLIQEITDSQAVITENFSPDAVLLSFRPYLESIFFNLISNAIKYRHPDRLPEISVNFRHENDIILAVSDNGLGIDLEANQSRLFNLYRRFHDHTDGKGIGLYLVKTQVRSLGGEIAVESTVNQGTTVIIYFTRP